MPQVGPLEILIVGAIALIVFGPQKLPEIARTVGNFLNHLRSMANEVRSEFSAGLEDLNEPVADEVTVEPPAEPSAEPSKQESAAERPKEDEPPTGSVRDEAAS